MRPEISEFSYGYALTEAIINDARLSRIVAAPRFPSLVEEGRVGGYDVELRFPSMPVFLQFKRSYRMVKRSRIMPPHFTTPYYRMYLNPIRYSEQHPMLMKLEGSGEVVYYAAPRFDTLDEFNSIYISGQMIHESVFIAPSSIGILPDENEHHIAFERNGSVGYLLSEPKRVQGKIEGEYFIPALLESLRKKKGLINSTEGFSRLAEKMVEIISEHNFYDYKYTIARKKIKVEMPENLDPLSRVVYLARNYFNSALLLCSNARRD